MYIYFPSCNFQRTFPKTAKVIRAYMMTQPDVTVAGCCHVTNGKPSPDDTIVTICQSCMHILEEVRSDVKNQITFCEFLLTRKDFSWPDLGGEAITLQDCFRARGYHSAQDAFRECLKLMNVNVVEMEHNRDEEEFDGDFRLHEPFPQPQKEAPRYYVDYLTQYVTLVPEEERPALFKEHCKLITTDRVVCYCNTCYKGLKAGGADAWHIAELAFSTQG